MTFRSDSTSVPLATEPDSEAATGEVSFRATCRHLLKVICKAITANNAIAVVAGTQMLADAALKCGAAEISRTAIKIETLAMQRRLTQAAKVVPMLRRHITRL